MNLYEKVRINLKESSDYWLDKFGQEDLDEYKNNQDEEGIPKNVEPFKVGDLVYLSYIHDTSPHNGVVGKLSWIHKYKYYPFGHKGDGETAIPKYQGKIDYADGDEELISDIYRKGSGVVSPLRKAPKEFKFGDKIPWNYNLKESEDNVVRVKDCHDDVDLIMAIEGDTVKVEDTADWERVKNLAKDFSRSQGFYGRLLRNMNEFEESYGGAEDLPFPILM